MQLFLIPVKIHLRVFSCSTGSLDAGEELGTWAKRRRPAGGGRPSEASEEPPTISPEHRVTAEGEEPGSLEVT